MAGTRDSGLGTRKIAGAEARGPSPESRNWDDMVVVGRIARPHGLRGQVAVAPETDFVAERFRPGATLWTRSAGRDEQLTIASARIQNGRAVIGLEGFSSIEAVERLAGLELRIPEASLQPLEPGRYYQHQLVGCAVEDADGDGVGTVVRVEGGAGGSRLVVEGPRGEVLVPLAAHICVEIDVGGRKIRIDPPEGLLDLNEPKRTVRTPNEPTGPNDLNEVRHRHDLSADGGGRARRRRDQPGH